MPSLIPKGDKALHLSRDRYFIKTIFLNKDFLNVKVHSIQLKNSYPDLRQALFCIETLLFSLLFPYNVLPYVSSSILSHMRKIFLHLI